MKHQTFSRSFVLSMIFILAAFSLVALAEEASQDPFAVLKARTIGPANMSGRIGAVAAVPSNPDTIYVGAAAGGVWKSLNGGTTWTPVFDDQPVASIGAIAINPRNPDVVWVGTGEAAPRNSVSVGRGIYLTLDGGKTWKLMGLEKTEKIAKIFINAENPDVVVVAALGATWGDSSERGVFKTTDGGRTWRKVLYVDQKTGAADMDMDPANPNRILVAMWEHRRWPWFFVSGGPGSGLYLSSDGGESWEKLGAQNGLPSGDLGRCGVGFAPSRPGVVYALVEAEKNVLLRSTDGGLNWQVANNEPRVHGRPFYYSRLWVNPVNENTLYILHSQLLVSEDAGKTIRPMASFQQSHSDYHAMWLHPAGEMMVVGNDGGVVISRDRGRSWRFMANLPLGQYYHVNYDMGYPYNLYGGLQDNGTWRGPAYSLTEEAVYDHQWLTVGGGDGFDAAPDPEDAACGYGMSQGGNLFYFDIRTGVSRPIVPTESDVKHRYNWNAGFAVDPFKPATIYLGSQFVHRSPDKGRTWEIISPDLTTNDPEKLRQSESGGLTLDVTNAENYCTILSIAPSPLREGLLWVGTDDGIVELTRDSGKTWELVSTPLYAGKKPLAPRGAAVPHIHPSRFEEGTAYVVLDDHRRSNFTSYAFLTRDYGQTWKSLATPDVDGYCFVLREDAVNRNLLFLGTEFGLFLSFDGGGRWTKWTRGLPACPVYDVAVHPRENDLIIATHGRSLYVVDDITPLREYSQEVAGKKLHLFTVPEATQFVSGDMSVYLSPGDAVFAGENKRTGACFSYFLTPEPKKAGDAGREPSESAMGGRPSGFPGGFAPQGPPNTTPTSRKVEITILDAQGRFVAFMNGSEEKGLNRAWWNFRETEPPAGGGRPGAGEEGGGFMFFRGRGGLNALPGNYTVKIKYEGQEASGTFVVKPDPRVKVDLDILKANYEKAKAAQKLSRAIMAASRQLQQTQRALGSVRELARAGRDPKTADLLKAADELEKKLKGLTETLNPTPPKQGIGDRSASLQSRVMMAVFGMSGAGIEPVSQAAQVRLDKVRPQLSDFLVRFNEFYGKDVENFKKALLAAGFSPFGPFEPLKID